MRFTTLETWLAWQESLHPREIDLGLERIQPVLQAMGREVPSYRVITVAGTNGKGSAAAMLDAILRAAGHRVGLYTSPHLVRYNERIRIDGREVQDHGLCAAFDRIDQARGDVTLTYFEFGTLAAFELFEHAGIDIGILEVGMGGRLDAVNLYAPDVALVTSVGVDHTSWLGEDRERIGLEKAGIFRSGRPAVCGDPVPPASLLAHADAIGAPLVRFGRDFGFEDTDHGWCWWGPGQRRDELPYPALPGAHQLVNAASVLMALSRLPSRYALGQEAVQRGLSTVSLPGRFQVLPGSVERILDVAHNVQAAQALGATLRQRPCGGRTLAVFGMLVDKDAGGVARAMAPVVDAWYLGSLSSERGLGGAALARAMGEAGLDTPVRVYERVAEAYDAAMDDARPGDRVVIFGSFYTLAEILVGLQGQNV